MKPAKVCFKFHNGLLDWTTGLTRSVIILRGSTITTTIIE